MNLRDGRKWAWMGMVVGFWGCAQVGSPDGGGRDTSPPQVLAAEPDFGARQVKPTLLRLVFDEFVQLQDARRQILVSPPLTEPPRARVRGREVLVELEGPLASDRTYVIQFGNAIRDLREANVADGLTHVFSTGMQLDSGRVSGGVFDAWTGAPSQGARVLLYRDSLPSAAINLALPDSMRPMPEYVGLVNDSGQFDIGYLPQGRFALVAVDDVNGNYRADAGEALAWSARTWSSSGSGDSTVALRLEMDLPTLEGATYLSGMRMDSSGYWRAKWVGWSDLAAGPDGWLPEEMELALAGPDTVLRPRLVGDSLWAEWPKDALEAWAGGEATWRFVHPFGEDTLRGVELEARRSPNRAGSSDREVLPLIGFAQRLAPLADGLDTALCRGSMVVAEDTLELDLARLFLEGPDLRMAPLSAGAKCVLDLYPGALSRGRVANPDTLRFTWRTFGDNDTGSLLLAVDSSEYSGMSKPLWVLTDGDGEPLYAQRPDAEGRWSGLVPGRYGLVVLDDVDGNGRWTGVDPVAGRPPEPVMRLAESVEVRAGWELELTGDRRPRP